MSETERAQAQETLQEQQEAVEQAEQDAGAPAEEPAGEQAADPVQEELAAARSLADEYLNLVQHVQADFDNFRRRNASVRADAYSEGQRNVAAAMLPVLDNLERALASAGEESPLRSGLELTLRQMAEVYVKLGVTPIDRLGEPFDPNLENAVMQGSPEDGDPGTVCQVLQRGYRMGDFILRHAMVKVVPDN